MVYYNKKEGGFKPKKPVRSFRDLEVYQRTLECSILVVKHLVPELIKAGFPLVSGITDCAMSVPLFVAESHSMRFSDFKLAVSTIERAMLGCNKMIVYLEQAVGLHGDKIDVSLTQDLCLRYVEVRGKMLRLERAWQKYKNESH